MSPRIFNSMMPCCYFHDHFYEQEQSKILKQRRYCVRRENETLFFNKKFIKYPGLTFQVLKPMRAPVHFNGKKKKRTGKKLLDFVKFGKISCFNFCKKKKKILSSARGDHRSRATTQTSRMGLVLIQINLIKLHREIWKSPN